MTRTRPVVDATTRCTSSFTAIRRNNTRIYELNYPLLTVGVERVSRAPVRQTTIARVPKPRARPYRQPYQLQWTKPSAVHTMSHLW